MAIIIDYAENWKDKLGEHKEKYVCINVDTKHIYPMKGAIFFWSTVDTWSGLLSTLTRETINVLEWKDRGNDKPMVMIKNPTTGDYSMQYRTRVPFGDKVYIHMDRCPWYRIDIKASEWIQKYVRK